MNLKVRRRLALLAGALCVGIACTLPATAQATQSDDGIWTIFTTTDAFPASDDASRWRYWFDAQARYFDLGSGINQYLVRPGIGYDFNANLSGWVGYARLRSRNRSGNVADENRYWQQLSWSIGKWNNGTVSLRARLEQRDLSTGSDVGVVLRVQGKYVRPVGTDGNRYVAVSIEPFVDLKDTDWGGDSGLGQNRSSVSIGWRVSERLTLEAGYMNQFIRVDNGENRMNHLGTLNFKMRL
ncbi:MAG: DUF2490 domain-containing protein [Woeseiaceae bacterium]